MNGLVNFNSIYLKLLSLKNYFDPLKPNCYYMYHKLNIKRVHKLRTEFDYVFPRIFVPVPSLCRQEISFNWILISACIIFIPYISSAHFLYRQATQLIWIFCITCITFLPCVISAPFLYKHETH